HRPPLLTMFNEFLSQQDRLIRTAIGADRMTRGLRSQAKAFAGLCNITSSHLIGPPRFSFFFRTRTFGAEGVILCRLKCHGEVRRYISTTIPFAFSPHKV